jgi:hypothetical protein
LRLGSGALALALLSARRPRPARREPGGWLSAACLCAYAAPFSFAYVRLGAAMGALVLFGAVQVTMIGWGIARGDRPSALAWVGSLLALAGLVILTAPGATAPDPVGAAGMAVAGIAWGAYSLRGRIPGTDPLRATASSFLRALPFVALLLGGAVVAQALHVTARGLALAVASGAVTSGVGYAIWYVALRSLSPTSAQPHGSLRGPTPDGRTAARRGHHQRARRAQLLRGRERQAVHRGRQPRHAHRVRHHGRLRAGGAADTCNDWTSTTAVGRQLCRHSWPRSATSGLKLASDH